MRSEEFERTLRRTLLTNETLISSGMPGLSGFKPDHPWGYIFLQSVHASNHHATAFWSTEVEKKCLLYQSRLRTEAELTSDGTVAAFRQTSIPHARPGGTCAPKGGRKRERSKSQQRSGGKGNPRTHTKGAASSSTDDTCRDFNRATSVGKVCKNGYVHKCAICNKVGHPAISCFQATAEQKERFASKGKCKGKSKQPKIS